MSGNPEETPQVEEKPTETQESRRNSVLERLNSYKRKSDSSANEGEGNDVPKKNVIGKLADKLVSPEDEPDREIPDTVFVKAAEKVLPHHASNDPQSDDEEGEITENDEEAVEQVNKEGAEDEPPVNESGYEDKSEAEITDDDESKDGGGSAPAGDGDDQQSVSERRPSFDFAKLKEEIEEWLKKISEAVPPILTGIQSLMGPTFHEVLCDTINYSEDIYEILKEIKKGEKGSDKGDTGNADQSGEAKEQDKMKEVKYAIFKWIKTMKGKLLDWFQKKKTEVDETIRKLDGLQVVDKEDKNVLTDPAGMKTAEPELGEPEETEADLSDREQKDASLPDDSLQYEDISDEDVFKLQFEPSDDEEEDSMGED